MWRGTAVSRIGAFTKIESMTRIVKGARSGICRLCWNHGARVCDDSDNVRLTVSCFTRTNVTRTRPELFELRTTKSEVMIVLD